MSQTKKIKISILKELPIMPRRFSTLIQSYRVNAMANDFSH